MKYIIILVLPLISFAKPSTPVATKKTEPVTWSCDGKLSVYNKNKEKDRWEEKANFKFEGPKNGNKADVDVMIEKQKYTVKFIYNEKGTMFLSGDDKVRENVSISVKVNDEIFDGGAFGAYNGTDLPKEIYIRQDFKFNEASHTLYITCKKNDPKSK